MLFTVAAEKAGIRVRVLCTLILFLFKNKSVYLGEFAV